MLIDGGLQHMADARRYTDEGELLPASTRGVWLSESFAEQDGWLVRDERIRWKDWLQRYGVKPPQRRALASA